MEDRVDLRYTEGKSSVMAKADCIKWHIGQHTQVTYYTFSTVLGVTKLLVTQNIITFQGKVK